MQDFVTSGRKKKREPFNLFGIQAEIYSKNEAKKILKDNSYYIFLASIINLVFGLVLYLESMELESSSIDCFVNSFVYLILALAISKLQSRIASVLCFSIFGWNIVQGIIENDYNGFFFYISFFFIAASYRSIKASFFYHKKEAINED